MVGQRTRTGCKTCRSRKLKCDETKPTCGQCRKSNRECVPSEGVAFRHAQNAGFVDKNGESLKSFYKYRQKFENTYFVPIPRELTFVHVSDPFAEDPTGVPPATSNAAAAQSSTVPHTTYAPPAHVQPGYVDVAASSLKAMIDPNLEAGTMGTSEAQEDVHHMTLEGITHAAEEAAGNVGLEMQMPEAESEGLNEKIMKALQHSDEQVKTNVEASFAT